jgi:hypothetical protein
VHSMWTTLGDGRRSALSTSGFTVNTVWRRKICPLTGELWAQKADKTQECALRN